jgi:hypothetical protein
LNIETAPIVGPFFFRTQRITFFQRTLQAPPRANIPI